VIPRNDGCGETLHGIADAHGNASDKKVVSFEHDFFSLWLRVEEVGGFQT
jgi:hypothetical protein